MSRDEAQLTAELALGRIFRLGARPFQPGDLEKYHAARSAFLDAAEVLGVRGQPQGPNWVQDRRKGAQGD